MKLQMFSITVLSLLTFGVARADSAVAVMRLGDEGTRPAPLAGDG